MTSTSSTLQLFVLRLFCLLSCIAGLTVFSMTAHSQSVKQTFQDNGAQVGIEYAKPIFSGSRQYAFTSGAWFLSGRIPIQHNATIIADFPLAYARVNSGPAAFRGFSGLRIGNPFIGVELRRPFTNVYGVFGARIPVANSRNVFIRTLGRAGSGIMRLESFGIDILPFYTKVGFKQSSTSGFYSSVLIGPSVFFFLESDNDPDAFLDAEAIFGYKNANFRGVIGLDGRLLITNFNANFADATIADVFVQGTYSFNQFRPALTIFFPVDENRITDLIISFTVFVHLN